mmetsp:Transcript_30755/g.27957  ORF Transcript_30755/g.27957 Transcript_30755/m.27957 type:complete len:107 (-) Transcript_30755:540-860(-)
MLDIGQNFIFNPVKELQHGVNYIIIYIKVIMSHILRQLNMANSVFAISQQVNAMLIRDKFVSYTMDNQHRRFHLAYLINILEPLSHKPSSNRSCHILHNSLNRGIG